MKQIMVGKWLTIVLSKRILFSESAINEAKNLITKWRQVFPKEETWVQNNFSVPSLIIRFDCIIDDSGRLRVYEIEDRPEGIGTTLAIHSLSTGSKETEFSSRLFTLKEFWPKFSVVISPKRVGSDDTEWLPLFNENSRLAPE